MEGVIKIVIKGTSFLKLVSFLPTFLAVDALSYFVYLFYNIMVFTTETPIPAQTLIAVDTTHPDYELVQEDDVEDEPQPSTSRAEEDWAAKVFFLSLFELQPKTDNPPPKAVNSAGKKFLRNRIVNIPLVNESLKILPENGQIENTQCAKVKPSPSTPQPKKSTVLPKSKRTLTSKRLKLPSSLKSLAKLNLETSIALVPSTSALPLPKSPPASKRSRLPSSPKSGAKLNLKTSITLVPSSSALPLPKSSPTSKQPRLPSSPKSAIKLSPKTSLDLILSTPVMPKLKSPPTSKQPRLPSPKSAVKLSPKKSMDLIASAPLMPKLKSPPISKRSKLPSSSKSAVKLSSKTLMSLILSTSVLPNAKSPPTSKESKLPSSPKSAVKLTSKASITLSPSTPTSPQTTLPSSPSAASTSSQAILSPLLSLTSPQAFLATSSSLPSTSSQTMSSPPKISTIILSKLKNYTKPTSTSVKVPVIRFASSKCRDKLSYGATEEKVTENNDSILKSTEKKSEVDISIESIKSSRIRELLKNEEIFNAFEKERQRLKNLTETKTKKTKPAKGEGVKILKSIPSSSPFYPESPKCEHECSFIMKILPKTKKTTEPESFADLHKRFKMELLIDNDLLNEIVKNKHNPSMARNVVNTGIVSKEARKANNFASRKSRMKQILFADLLEDSVRAQKNERNLMDRLKQWAQNTI